MQSHDADLRRTFFHLGILALAGALLYWARSVMIPITVAVLVVFVLAPVVSWLERRGVPRFLASTLMIITVAVMLIGIVPAFLSQMSSLTEEAPAYKTRIAEKISDARATVESSWLGDMLNLHDALDKPAPDGKEPGFRLNDLPVFSVVQSIAGTLFDVVIILVLALLMLMRREDLRNRTIYLLGSENLVTATRAMDDASARISRFLFSQLLLNAGCGLVIGIGLYFIGIPYAYLFGALAGLLRYIPFLGGWMAAAPPLLASLIMPDWTPFLLTGAFFIVVEMLQANLVEPLVFGHSIGISGAGQLIAAMFWACLWGPVGLILSTPLTACLCVMGRHFPVLRFLTLLMDEETAVDKQTALYQRLLADDSTEASDLVEAFATEATPQAAIDEMLVPALVLAEGDRKQGALSKEDETSITDAVRDLFYDVVAPQEKEGGESAAPLAEGGAIVHVIEFPFNNDIDDLILEMLRVSAVPNQWSVELVKNQRLEGMTHTDEGGPVVIVLSTAARHNHGRVRGACRAVRKRFPEAPILVCCWGQSDGVEALRVRLLNAGATAVCTTVREAHQFIERTSAPSEKPALVRAN